MHRCRFRGGRGAIGAGQSLRGRRGVGRGRWPGRGRGQGKTVSREQLDNQLDEYMTKTRTQLDSDLDVYMNQGDN